MNKKKCSTTNCDNMTSEGKCIKCRSPPITISQSRKCAKCENRVRKNELCAACSRLEKKLKPCGFPGCTKKTKDDICSTCKIRSLSKTNKAAYETFISGAGKEQFQQQKQVILPPDNIYQPTSSETSETSDTSDSSSEGNNEDLFLTDLNKLLTQYKINARKTGLIKKIVKTIICDEIH